MSTTFEGAPSDRSSFLRKLSSWGSLVRFSHTIFALPFALGMLVLLLRTHSVSILQGALLIVCLVSARTAAMAFNRIIDRKIDAQNPRTSSREIPAGKVSVPEAWLLCSVSILVFLVSTWFLGAHCLVLAPVVLLVLLGYSLAKRYTSSAHLILGLALALAPGGVWYAITATFALEPIPLMVAILFWVAGFDILYSCQDESFDRSHSLFSIPAAFGVERAFQVAKLFHVLAILFLSLFGFMMSLSWVYYGFVFLFGTLLFRQYQLIMPSDLSRIDAAFFTQNGLASMVFLVSCMVELLL